MSTIAIICIVAYVVVMPILFRLLAFAHKKIFIERKQAKKVDPSKIPAPIWPVWKERLKFAFKDSRPMRKESGPKRSMILIGIWILGLVLAVVAGFTSKWMLLLLSFVVFFLAMGYGISSPKSILETRKNVYAKIYEISCLKGVTESGKPDPREVVQVLKWENYVDPTEVKFNISSKFSNTGEDGFLQHFNQYFGTELTWVPNFDEQTGATGWDYKNSVVTIHTVPPLPGSAPWDEHYALDPGIAWSFFALGLGVENGVELPNPKTGQIENVLGFDVSGMQKDVGKEAGYKVSPKISTTPMAMVAGATGGGKAEDADTLVAVLVDD